jgi:hypothetical protein
MTLRGSHKIRRSHMIGSEKIWECVVSEKARTARFSEHAVCGEP